MFEGCTVAICCNTADLSLTLPLLLPTVGQTRHGKCEHVSGPEVPYLDHHRTPAQGRPDFAALAVECNAVRILPRQQSAELHPLRFERRPARSSGSAANFPSQIESRAMQAKRVFHKFAICQKILHPRSNWALHSNSQKAKFFDTTKSGLRGKPQSRSVYSSGIRTVL